jgi:hypothetical protein
VKYSFLICKIDELWKVPREEEVDGASEIEALVNLLLCYKNEKPAWYNSNLYVYGIRNGIISSFQNEYEIAMYKCLQKEKELILI